VVQCDVGQGDALVARSGVDRAVLVDAGPDPELVDGCLRRLGVHHLDLVLLTHHHADHVAGLPGALHGRDARQILVSPLAQPADNAARVRRWAAVAGVPVSVGADATGEIDGTGDSAGYRVRWRLFAPRFLPVAGTVADDDGTVVNESSLAGEFELRGPPGVLHLVDLGDLETQGQRTLAVRVRDGTGPVEGPVDVVKVAHHGSSRQDAELYRQLDARIGLIGVGAGNDYGHPAASALAMLRDVGTGAFRTDLSGDVAVLPFDAGALRVVTRG
jgi:competence protein ComEC